MRLAIGAEPGTVIRSVVRQTLVLAGAGILVGVPLALLTSSVGRGVLVGVEPTEPAAYLVGAAVLVLIALAASWLPARRAAAVDPVTALRTD